MKYKIAMFLLFASMCVAEIITTNVFHIVNHGGWGLSVNLGADKGDTITLDVRCDHDVDGECFTSAPVLSNSTKFNLKTNEFQHQVWEIKSPTRGDQNISANYYWVGDSVHYEIVIVAKEKKLI